jgi:hypothetical protein
MAVAGDAQITHSNNVWYIENDILKASIVFTAEGQIRLTSFYNKESSTEYLTGSGESSLFLYKGLFLKSTVNHSAPFASEPFILNANAFGWNLGNFTTSDIVMTTPGGTQMLGKKLSIPVHNGYAHIKLVFEIYNGRSGIRYQAFIKNISNDFKMIIEESDVIKLNFPNSPHTIHYVTNTRWLSTTGAVQESVIYNRGRTVAKCLLNLYSSNDGWYIAPEVNWKTQYGPEISNSTGSPGHEYMLRSFAGVTAWATSSSNVVKVSTCPEAFQLILFPNEEFEYIAVNLSVFKGDIVDGKMAIEEHLRKRFRYNTIYSIFFTSDWDWFTNGNRNETFYKSVVIPQVKRAGLDMIMLDDGWNNLVPGTTKLDNEGISRDKVEAEKSITADFSSFTNYIVNEGLLFGLWYSMSGGYHNRGNDLAYHEVISSKRQKIEYMLDHYNISHQMIDLTEFWQNLEEMSYSHASDNVYRKNVLTRNLMNDLVTDHPHYLPKVTSELDIFPTQGDRSVELIHIPYNGWHTAKGDANSSETLYMDVAASAFGHLPLNSVYFNAGKMSGKMEDYYSYMIARSVKFPQQPDKWLDGGILQMARFNHWRKSARVKTLTEQIVRPVYYGKDWNNSVASAWSFGSAPYIWMYTTAEKDEALLLATTAGKNSEATINASLRWLDSANDYLIEDITLDDTGITTYRFKGKFSGAELIAQGFAINLYENTSRGKAFWIKRHLPDARQVLYADENIFSYHETLIGNKLIITATGKPSTQGNVIVYGNPENKTALALILFDHEGNGSAEIESIETDYQIDLPGFAGTIRYDLENYHATLQKSSPDIIVSSVSNGTPDPELGTSSLARMTTVGDYVIYNLEIPAAGKYTISVNYKLSTSSRGVSQWHIKDDTKPEVSIGSTYDQSASTESMKTLSLGEFTFDTAGIKEFKITLTAPGSIGDGKNLSTNYILLTRVP